MKISELCQIKVNFLEADFWLIRSHNRQTVGKPVTIFNSDYIGIKVVRTDILRPKYLFYVFTDLHNKGVFALVAKGSLNLVHLRAEDVENISCRS